MRAPRLTAGDRMIGVVAVALLFACAMIAFAMSQPWLGITLQVEGQERVVASKTYGPARQVPPGTRIAAVGAGHTRMEISAADLLIEPDGNLPTYADYDAFLTRQDKLAAIMRAHEITLYGDDGASWQIAPASHRPASDLPAEFWVQLVVGVFAWLVSGAVWVFRRTERAARYLLLSGVSTLVFAPFAGGYGSRELALAAVPFRFLSDANFLGGSVFVAALVALMLYYPRAIAPAWVGRATVAIFIGWFAAQQIGLFDSMIFARRFLVFVGLIATFALASVQWRHTRYDPVARAALQWFLLSWLIGCSSFAALIFVPQMFGIDTSQMQSYGFLLFLPVYGGLAFGIIRYRLFDLGEWWARVVTWMLSIVLLVLVDMLFLLALNLSPGLSVGLSLLICGVVWLPLRGLLWRRFVGRQESDARGRFQSLVDAAFQKTEEDRAKAWSELLANTFGALEIEFLHSEIDEVQILDHGLALAVPGAGNAGPVRLTNAHGGRKLFKRGDADLASDLVAMFDHLVRNREAFDAGVATERQRIARDIHDHVGASLMDALHSDHADRKDRLIRHTLSDLRGIISDSAQQDQPIELALAQIRRETAERLEAKRIRLDWQSPLSPVPIDAMRLHVTRSIVREAVSNAIKHSGCASLKVAIALDEEELSVAVEDDGRGFDPHRPAAGAGLKNIRDRTSTAGGKLYWLAPNGDFRTRLLVHLPNPTGT